MLQISLVMKRDFRTITGGTNLGIKNVGPRFQLSSWGVYFPSSESHLPQRRQISSGLRWSPRLCKISAHRVEHGSSTPCRRQTVCAQSWSELTERGFPAPATHLNWLYWTLIDWLDKDDNLSHFKREISISVLLPNRCMRFGTFHRKYMLDD